MAKPALLTNKSMGPILPRISLVPFQLDKSTAITFIDGISCRREAVIWNANQLQLKEIRKCL